jgi:hypothetical protein
MCNKLYANIEVIGLEKLKNIDAGKSIKIKSTCINKTSIILEILET